MNIQNSTQQNKTMTKKQGTHFNKIEYLFLFILLHNNYYLIPLSLSIEYKKKDKK